MEEFREAAKVFFNNASEEIQKLAKNFFNSMDTDGDGRVTRDEFVKFIQEKASGSPILDHFDELDSNGDGSLDFNEALTMYYMIQNSTWCRGCRIWLPGLCFTCQACFVNGGNTFDLCSSCYGGQSITHTHNKDQFLGNLALLRSIRKGIGKSNGGQSDSASTAANLANTSQPQRIQRSKNHSGPAALESLRLLNHLESLRLLNRVVRVGGRVTILGLRIGAIAAASQGGCNIM